MANLVEEGLSVVVSLIDFHVNNSIMMNNHHFDQLQTHMRTYRKRIPFSRIFMEIDQIVGPDDNKLGSAIDAQISYSHNCICVADELLERIVFFDLKTHEFIKSFEFGETLACLLIEENFDGQNNDAIYFAECESWCSTFGYTVKYRIKDLLKDDSNVKPIWRNTELHDNGMAIRMKNKQKQLLRFNSQKKIMNIMDTINGNIIGSFKLNNVAHVSDLIFITPTKMIISESQNNKCYIFEENGGETSSNEWKLIKQIEHVNSVKISLPFRMTIDRAGKLIFISDYPKRLIVIDYDGKVLHTYESIREEGRICGLCVDERTGLLYVTFQKSRCIRVFK